MKRFISKKTVAIGLTAGLILGAGGAAFAYFSSSGTGTGSATVGTSGGVNIAQTNTVAGLVPNGPAQTIDYTVTNPLTNPGSEFVNQVTVSVASVSGAGTLTGAGIDACTPSLFTVTQGLPIGQTLASGGTANGTATISLPDDGNNQDNCQGVTLNLSYSSN